MSMHKVWILDGCSMCGLCESTCPEVFSMGDESAEVNEQADFEANAACITEAAADCPADVIRYE